MRIHYLWIKKYKNIVEQGFNFSSKFIFDYDVTSGRLGIKINEKHIPDFYGSEISELTAIVGENGTGKTNVLDFICRQIIDNNLSTSVVFVTEQNIYYTEDLECNVIDEYIKKGLSKDGFFINKINFQPFIRPDSKAWDVSSISSVVIYYSDFIRRDFRNAFKRETFHFDISTSFLFWGEKREYFKSKSYLALSNQGIYFFEELKRHIKYITFIGNESFSFVPKEASIMFNNYDLTALDNEEKSERGQHEKKYEDLKIGDNKWEIYDRILEKIKKWNFDFHDFESFSDCFYKAVFVNRVRHNLAFKMDYYELEDAEKAIDLHKDNGKKLLSEYFKSNQRIRYQTNNKEKEQLKKSNYLKKINDEITLILSLIESAIEDGSVTFLAGEAVIGLSVAGKKLLKSIFSSYEKLITEFGFLNFLWQDLSTGESAYLSLSARLFEVAEKLKDEHYKPSDLIIMLDEAESHFHPQWQKYFFLNLRKVLVNLFPKKSIQIILTSHSPFIVSDFLLANIIFLKRGLNGYCIVNRNPLEDKKATFASNIHTLFTDSFFLKDGLIGEFAKEEINAIIDKLKSPKVMSKEEQDRCKMVISEIGEPLIRRKLLQLIEDYSKVNYNQEILDLQRRVTDLEIKKNDSNKDS